MVHNQYFFKIHVYTHIYIDIFYVHGLYIYTDTYIYSFIFNRHVKKGKH